MKTSCNRIVYCRCFQRLSSSELNSSISLLQTSWESWMTSKVSWVFINLCHQNAFYAIEIHHLSRKKKSQNKLMTLKIVLLSKFQNAQLLQTQDKIVRIATLVQNHFIICLDHVEYTTICWHVRNRYWNMFTACKHICQSELHPDFPC